MQLVLLKVWSDRRTPGSRKAMLIGLTLFPLLLSLQAFVVTDREKITIVCNDLVEAVRDGEMGGISRHIAHEFDAEGIDREQFLDGVRSTLSTYHVENPRLHGLSVETDGKEATANFGVTCRIVTSEEMVPNLASAWRVTLRLIAGRWQVVSVKPRSTPVFPFSSIRQFVR